MLGFSELSKTLLENGIYIETLLVIYTLPVLITIINFFKYIIGTKVIGTYTPILIVYIIWTIAGIGITYPTNISISNFTNEIFITFILLISLFSSISIFYSVFYKFKLHYLAKISAVLIFGLISLILLFWTLTKFEINVLEKLNPLSILLILLVSEQFLASYIKYDLAKAINLFTETFIVSIFSYFIVIQPQLLNILIINPWLILITLPINILTGKFTGLRLTEYFRFYELLANNKNADNRNSEE